VDQRSSWRCRRVSRVERSKYDRWDRDCYQPLGLRFAHDGAWARIFEPRQSPAISKYLSADGLCEVVTLFGNRSVTVYDGENLKLERLGLSHSHDRGSNF
jgi:hypothetical protein